MTSPGVSPAGAEVRGVHHRVYFVGPTTARRDSLLCALRAVGYHVIVRADLDAIRADRQDVPAVIIIDGMSDPSSLSTLRAIRAHSEGCSIVLLADFAAGLGFVTALQAGVSGFCAPDAPDDAIVRTVEDVVAYGAAIPRPLVAALVAHLRHGRGYALSIDEKLIELTDKEWSVLTRLRLRLSTEEIAAELFVSKATVRSHVSALVRKFEVASREDVIAALEEHRGQLAS